MNRSDWQRLTEERLADATVLLSAGRHDGAYYLMGYVVECALKACVAKQTREHDFPDIDRAKLSHSHKFEDLLKAAALARARAEEEAADPEFAKNWATIKDWSSTVRYDRVGAKKAADALTAVTEPTHGVLKWLKHHW